MTVYLARATHFQTGFSPHSKGACNGFAGAAYTWHRPAGANESFFEAAGRLNSTVATPVKMCRSFVEEWQYGVTLTVFAIFISTSETVAFFGTLAGARQRGETLKDMAASGVDALLGCASLIPKLTVVLVAGILYFLPEWAFRCLPLSIKSKGRFGRRFALKTGLALEQETELEVVRLKGMYRMSKRRSHSQY